MAVLAPAALKFTVHRRPAILVAPAAPTPHELKLLSDIDDQDGLRVYVPSIHFYRHNASMDARNPALVIREAVARALLVDYYPLAGRLRELEGRKLAVDCTGEGVLFIEADADVRLQDFGDALCPPFPCIDELLFDVPDSSTTLDSPLLHFQVTRLACGGFILAIRTQHAVADAQGLLQFLGAVAELARGGASAAPSVRPVWMREQLLRARDPPRPSFAHREYDDVPLLPGTTIVLGLGHDQLVERSFFFGAADVASLRAQLEPHLQKRATTYEILAGCLWKCRTAALAPADAGEEMRLVGAVNARGKKSRGRLIVPEGYYGNAFAFPAAVASAGELRARPLSHAVGLVRKAKAEACAEYMQSVADLMVLRGRPLFAVVGAFVVSDVTKAGFRDVDFGWGRPVYGGVAVSPAPGLTSNLVAYTNAKGENGVVVSMCLPGPAMDRFVEEIGKLIRRPAVDVVEAAPQRPREFATTKLSAL